MRFALMVSGFAQTSDRKNDKSNHRDDRSVFDNPGREGMGWFVHLRRESHDSTPGESSRIIESSWPLNSYPPHNRLLA